MMWRYRRKDGDVRHECTGRENRIVHLGVGYHLRELGTAFFIHLRVTSKRKFMAEDAISIQ